MLVTAQAVAALIGVGGVVAATRPARHLLGAWIIVGSAFWAAGMGITTVRAIAGDSALPHPGHLLWLISLVLALIGTVRRPGPHRDYVGPFLALDIVMVAGSWLLLVWRLAIWRPGMDSLIGVNWAALLVLFMDLLMCATVVQLMTDNRTKSMITMSLGVVLLVAADAVAAATEGSQPGNLLRLVLVVGAALLTFAGVASSNGSPVTSSRADDSRVRQVLTMTLVVTAIGGYMVAMSGHSTDTVSRLVAVVVLGCFGAREVYRGRRGRALPPELGHRG